MVGMLGEGLDDSAAREDARNSSREEKGRREGADILVDDYRNASVGLIVDLPVSTLPNRRNQPTIFNNSAAREGAGRQCVGTQLGRPPISRRVPTVIPCYRQRTERRTARGSRPESEPVTVGQPAELPSHVLRRRLQAPEGRAGHCDGQRQVTVAQRPQGWSNRTESHGLTSRLDDSAK